MASYEKVYVAMLVRISEEGKIKPVAVEWEDGKRYKIDKITDESNAPPEHTGGIVTRKFKVLIYGREKTLYFEKNSKRWFVEKLL